MWTLGDEGSSGATRTAKGGAATLLLGAALAGGCSAPDDPTDEDYDDVARVMATQIGGPSGDLAAMEASVAMVSGEAVAGIEIDAGEAHWVFGGLMAHFVLQCWDAGGTELPACDASTDAASVDAAFTGEVGWPGFMLAVGRTGDWNLAGLQSDQPRFDGAGGLELDVAYDGAQREGRLELDVATDYDLTWDRPTKRVAQGELGMQIHALRYHDGPHAEVDAELDIEARVELDGDGHALITLDGSHHYDLEVASGAIDIDVQIGD